MGKIAQQASLRESGALHLLLTVHVVVVSFIFVCREVNFHKLPFTTDTVLVLQAQTVMNSQVLLLVAVLFASVSITNGDHTKGIRTQGQFGKSSLIMLLMLG